MGIHGSWASFCCHNKGGKVSQRCSECQNIAVFSGIALWQAGLHFPSARVGGPSGKWPALFSTLQIAVFLWNKLAIEINSDRFWKEKKPTVSKLELALAQKVIVILCFGGGCLCVECIYKMFCFKLHEFCYYVIKNKEFGMRIIPSFFTSQFWTRMFSSSLPPGRVQYSSKGSVACRENLETYIHSFTPHFC